MDLLNTFLPWFWLAGTIICACALTFMATSLKGLITRRPGSAYPLMAATAVMAAGTLICLVEYMRCR